ncbi:MAG: DNA polymerase IV [Bacillota bacterium]
MGGRRIILHLDMDAFFASVEQAAHPGWRGKPVVICGEGRSVVATASYEARKLGVKSGQPAGEAKKLAPEAVFVPGNHGKYVWSSLNILEILGKYSPLVEPHSIDEAFADLSGNPEASADPAACANRIKREIREKFGLTCSIGIGSNKLLAKVASDRQKPDGLTVVPADETGWLHALPVEALPGLGEKTAAYLHESGITMIGDLALMQEAVLVQWFGRNGSVLRRMARGEDDAPVQPEFSPLKSISQEWTMPRDTDEAELISGALLWLARLVGRRLRAEGQEGRTVAVKIRYPDFRTVTRAQTVQGYVCLDDEICKIAREVFFRNWRGEKIRLLGVKVSNLSGNSPACTQAGLWPDARERRRDLARAVDRLRDKYGEDIVRPGSNLALFKKV